MRSRHDRRWHKETRASMPEMYDAIWQDGFWKGVGVVLAVGIGAWLLAEPGTRLMLKSPPTAESVKSAIEG